MADDMRNVLFLCTGNSARSIIAECVLRREGIGKFNAYSAGSMPAGQVNPFALDLLKRENHKTDDLRSKNWDEFAAPDAPEMDFVFTVCDSAAAEVCPVWPGQPMTAHWGVPDPAAVEGDDAIKAAADLGEQSLAFTEMEMGVLCAIAYHQPIDRAVLRDIFGKEVGRDLLARLRYRDLIASGPRSPRPGAPHTFVTTETFLMTFDLQNLRDLPELELVDHCVENEAGTKQV